MKGQRVPEVPLLATVNRAQREADDQIVAALVGGQEGRAPIRARVRSVDSYHNRLRERAGKQNSLCYGVVLQQQRLRVPVGHLARPLVPLGGVSVSAEIGSFANNPG